MGFKTLDAVLNWEEQQIPKSSLYCIIDDGVKANGEFLLQHFIANQLTTPNPSTCTKYVIFLALNSIFNHHNIILRKMGCNLAQAREQGRFVFLDLAAKLNASDQWGDFLTYVYKEVINSIEQLDETASKLLIIDDISLLTLYGCPAPRVIQLILSLKNALFKRGGSILTLTHADEIFSEHLELSKATKGLLHLSNGWFRVAALTSGHSQDVHGQLTIHAGPQWLAKSEAQTIGSQWGAVDALPTLHYQLRDNNVTFFPKGTAKGVL